jgi:hypothetical protein
MVPGTVVYRTDVNMTGIVLAVSNGFALVDFGTEDTTYMVPVGLLVKQ